MGIETIGLGSGTVEAGHLWSLLFDETGGRAEVQREQPPESFADLNLDQVVAGILAGREGRHLEPYYFSILPSAEAVAYRHEVYRDLEDPALLTAIRAFLEHMVVVRQYLAFAEKFSYLQERQRWLLDAASEYCAAVASLSSALKASPVTARALSALREYLDAYVVGEVFTTLGVDAERVRDLLDGITYSVHIRSGRVEVSRFAAEPDYTAEVTETFARFRQGAVTEYRVRFNDRVDMNHVEGKIVELVAKLFPDEFAELAGFCQAHSGFVDEIVSRFEHEVEFYTAYLDYTDPLRSGGLSFCYPVVSERFETEQVLESFDVALASILVREHRPVVTNGYELSGPERVLVVTGPNQGGKTTFARMVGQLHHLAGIGCPVPGRGAELVLVDKVLTHFEQAESLTTQSGKLQDDLVRIKAILDRSTGRSLVVLNEIFTSTTAEDALVLGREVLYRVIGRDLLCVCVTFVDELSRLAPSTVSMVGTVAPEDPTVRTFKIVRKPSDGRAYALVLAEKYGLTYEQLQRRIRP